MTDFINITLDTEGPRGAGLCINQGEEETCNTRLKLSLTCSDDNTQMYQMKIWSDALDITEETSSWEEYRSMKYINVIRDKVADGNVTVYVRLRDDVLNESETVNDSIFVDTDIPFVDITGITGARLTKITSGSGFAPDRSIIEFTVDRDCAEARVMVVNDEYALVDDPYNILIPSAGNSCIMDADGNDVTGIKGLSLNNAVAGRKYTVFISGADLESASPCDGIKIIKIFAREYNGRWSV